MSPRTVKIVVAILWALAAAAWIWRLRVTGASPVESAQGFIDAADGAWWAIPAYVAAYLARPLVFFPALLLTVAAGIMFGPVVGVAVVIVAANASAMVAYAVGTTFSPEALRAEGGGSLLDRWAGRLRRESLVTVMLMRLAFVPYDVVSYASGFLRINRGAFLAATALGSLPGTVAFVLAGASLERLDEGLDGFDPEVFAASVVMFLVSLAVSRVVKRRTSIGEAAGAAPPVSPG